MRHWVWYVTDPQTGAQYEVEGRPDQGSMARWKAYLSIGGETVGMWVNETWSGGTSYIHWFLKDHLGSTVGFVGTDGALVQRIGYELWGKKRSGYTWVDDASEQGGAETNAIYGPHDRGFTGHEHLFSGLIHMNGRVYDPVLGKFLSPDPIGQMVGNTQGLNRYSYVDNNPLGYTDPTGHGKFWKKLKLMLKGFMKPKNLLMMAVIFAASYFLAPMLASALYMSSMAAEVTAVGLAYADLAAGAIFQAAQTTANLVSAMVGGALAGAISGGSIKSAVIGGVFGGISAGIGSYLGNATLGSERWFMRVGAHAMAGGARAQLSGGRFVAGALGAGVSAGVGGFLHEKLGESGAGKLGGLVAASSTGGLAAVAASGGKTSAFMSGFTSAAFEYAFNTSLHPKEGWLPAIGKWLGRATGAFSTVLDLAFPSSLNMGEQEALEAYRQDTANEFYSQNTTMTAEQIASHTSGIDYTRSVNVVTLRAGTSVIQYQEAGRGMGRYFAPVGTPVETLGVSGNRIATTYVLDSDVKVLQSTAVNTSNSMHLAPEYEVGAVERNTLLQTTQCLGRCHDKCSKL